MREERIWAVVPAGGAGSRMGAPIPKQYLPLAGRPILSHTLERLCACLSVRGVVAGIAKDDSHWAQLEPDARRHSRFIGAYVGGAMRADTVLAGLRALSAHAGDEDWVLVHDAVRPCIRHSDIEKLVVAVSTHPEGGLLALPMADTVKRSDPSGCVLETVPREHLWRALTPQMFRIGRLRRALERAAAQGREITDEASAIENLGDRPVVVAGRPDNIKITHPADLELAELYLVRQAQENAAG